MRRESFSDNRKMLYKIHEYDPKTGQKNIHHIVFRSEGGGNDFDNLSLIDKDLHKFIHYLIQMMDNQAR